jgi:putative transposase
VEHDSRILGSKDFVKAIMREADEKMVRQMWHRGDKVSIEEVIRKMCKGEGVKAEELQRGRQRRKVSEVRAKIAYYLSREMGISMAEIARNLGVGTSTISMAIRKEECGK